MRITGGRYAGRRLTVPKGPRIRETTDQTRKNLFNLLGDRVAGARVLDLFCGTGSLGLEALSRGAAHVTFVDHSQFCLAAVRENLGGLLGDTGRGTRVRRSLGEGGRDTFVIRADALNAIRRLGQRGTLFDLIFLDPPYDRELARKSLNNLGRYAIVSPSGLVIAEHGKRDSLPASVEGEASRLVLQRQARYGDTALTIYQKQ